MQRKNRTTNAILSCVLTLLSLVWVYPVFMVVINSLKLERAINTSSVFRLPTAETFAGLSNFVNAISSKGFLSSFWYSLFITISSVALILLCCSMCAWYVTRVETWFTKLCYFLFVFSMVVPFQMLMFTLSSLADRIGSRVPFLPLNTPYGICIVYLGFGAGLATFMFTGFMKSIPLEIEEAAMIDGCSPIRTFFSVVFPILKPTLVSVGILETMWVWNDYLLPYLVLDRKKYMTIPILVQYFRGSYGRVEMGPMMACIVLTIVPIIIVYLCGQKHIIKGVVAGAVKGDRSMTIKDLAKLSGYSLGTVSRVLNGHPNVSEKARAAVMAVVEAQGFALNANAKNLRQTQGNGVLVIVKGRGNELFSAMVEQLQAIFSKTEYPLAIDYIDELDSEVSTPLGSAGRKSPWASCFWAAVGRTSGRISGRFPSPPSWSPAPPRDWATGTSPASPPTTAWARPAPWTIS